MSEGKLFKFILTLIITFLAFIMIYYFFRSLYMLSFFPIYPDEIAERTILSRVWYDFPMKSLSIPMCRSYIQKLSWTAYFPGTLEWILHGHIYSLKTLRASGLVISLLFYLSLTVRVCCLHLKLYGQLYKKLLFIIICFGVIVSLFSIGVVPFFLITVRPEQTMLLLLSIVLLLFAIPSNLINTFGKKIIVSLSYYICFSVTLYMHPKGLLLTPIFFIVAYKIFSNFNSKLFVTMIFALLIMMVIGSYYVWANFYDCANYPSVNAIFKSFSIDLHNILSHPSLFVSEIKMSLLDYKREIDQISFQTNTDASYLPQINLNYSLKIVNFLIQFNYIALFILLFIASIMLYLQDIRKKQIITNRLLVLVLFFCVILNLILCKTKHWYDAGYLWSLFAIAAVFLGTDYVKCLLKKSMAYMIIIYLFILGIFSIYFLISTFEPYFQSGYAGPSIPLIGYDYKKTELKLKKLEGLCGIDLKTAKGLILDDATYLHFQKAKYPIPFTYLYLAFDLKSFLNFLSNKPQIDGLIIRKAYIASHSPEAKKMFKKYAFYAGEFACLPKSKIIPILKMTTFQF